MNRKKAHLSFKEICKFNTIKVVWDDKSNNENPHYSLRIDWRYGSYPEGWKMFLGHGETREIAEKMIEKKFNQAINDNPDYFENLFN